MAVLVTGCAERRTTRTSCKCHTGICKVTRSQVVVSPTARRSTHWLDGVWRWYRGVVDPTASSYYHCDCYRTTTCAQLLSPGRCTTMYVAQQSWLSLSVLTSCLLPRLHLRGVYTAATDQRLIAQTVLCNRLAPVLHSAYRRQQLRLALSVSDSPAALAHLCVVNTQRTTSPLHSSAVTSAAFSSACRWPLSNGCRHRGGSTKLPPPNHTCRHPSTHRLHTRPRSLSIPLVLQTLSVSPTRFHLRHSSLPPYPPPPRPRSPTSHRSLSCKYRPYPTQLRRMATRQRHRLWMVKWLLQRSPQSTSRRHRPSPAPSRRPARRPI